MVRTAVLCMMLTGMFGVGEHQTVPLPTGASLAWTSTDSAVVKARELIEAGLLTRADAVVAAVEEECSAESRVARKEMREIIRRLRLEYAQTADELLAKLRKSIPNVTVVDLERWRADGKVQFRLFDGQVYYFIAEPKNLFRLSQEAKRRRDTLASSQPSQATTHPTPDERLHAELKQIIAEAKKTGKTQVRPVKHRITYKLTVLPNRPGAKAGSMLQCWLPFPQEYRQQKSVRLIRTSPQIRQQAASVLVAPSAWPAGRVDGPFTGAPQRTVYFEQRVADPAVPVVFEEEFEYVSYAYYPRLDDKDAKTGAASVDPMYLAERPPHIVFTPQMRATVDRVVGDATNPLKKARRIFRFIHDEIRWVIEQEYSTIPSLSMRGLRTRTGDCGVQSMLFITMCRVAGIPSRWQSGWSSKPGDTNMHDWAEIYIEPWGWLPVDVSYGLQTSDDLQVREFYLGHLDAYRLIVNLDYGRPLQPPKSGLRSEPADFQRGEVSLDGRNLYFDDWTYDITFDLECILKP